MNIWIIGGAVAGLTSFIFAGLGDGIKDQLIPVACDRDKLNNALTTTFKSPMTCVGAYVLLGVFQFLTVTSTGLTGVAGWKWYVGSDKEETERGVQSAESIYLPALKKTMYGGMDHTWDMLQYISDVLQEDAYSVSFVGLFYDEDRGQSLFDKRLFTRDTAQPGIVTWMVDAGDHNKTIITPYEQFNETVTAYRDYTNGIIKHFEDDSDGPGWLSYNTYGYNHYVEDYSGVWFDYIKDYAESIGNVVSPQVQPAEQLLEEHNKFCLAYGKTNVPGSDSIVVGQVYWGSYGGIEDQCDSD